MGRITGIMAQGTGGRLILIKVSLQEPAILL
jgi:hypothetical protein